MKIIKMMILLLSFAFFSSCVSAYSTDTYTVDVPNEYTLDISSTDDLAIFSKNTQNKQPNFNVNVNPNNGTNVNQMTESDIMDSSNQLLTKLTSTYNMPVDIIKKEKTKINDYDAVLISLKWNSKEKLGYYVYQNQYMFTSKNNIYTITFSADKTQDLNSLESKNIINSFVISDSLEVSVYEDANKDIVADPISEKSFDFGQAVVVGVICAGVFILFTAIKGKIK